jgi:hypothetical protein
MVHIRDEILFAIPIEQAMLKLMQANDFFFSVFIFEALKMIFAYN